MLKLPFCSAAGQGAQVVDVIPVTITKLKYQDCCCTGHRYGIILKIETVQNNEKKKLRNYDKQILVIKVQMKDKKQINTT